MMLTIQAPALAAAAAAAAAFTAPRPTAPWAQYGLLRASPGRLRISCQTETAWVNVDVPASVDAAGEMCAPVADLAKMAGTLGPVEVSLRATRSQLVIESARGEIRVPGMSPSEWPALPPAPDSPAWVTIPGALAGRIVHAVAKDAAIYGMNGAHVERVEGGIRFVATDGYRVAYLDAEAGDLVLPAHSLVSREALLYLSKLESAEAAIVDGHLVLRSGSTMAGFRLIDGTFPDYRNMLPRGAAPHTCQVRTADLGSALARAGRVTGKAPVILRLVDGDLTVERRNVDGLGEFVEEVPGTVTGPDLAIAFSLELLADALIGRGETTRLEFWSPLQAARVTSPDAPGVDVLMPIQAHGEKAVERAAA